MLKDFFSRFIKKTVFFFKGLQYRSEEERIFWFWFFFILAMIIVVILWLLSTSYVVRSPKSPTEEEISLVKEPGKIFQMVETLKIGLEKTGQDIFHFWQKIGEEVSRFLANGFSSVLQFFGRLF